MLCKLLLCLRQNILKLFTVGNTAGGFGTRVNCLFSTFTAFSWTSELRVSGLLRELRGTHALSLSSIVSKIINLIRVGIFVLYAEDAYSFNRSKISFYNFVIK